MVPDVSGAVGEDVSDGVMMRPRRRRRRPNKSNREIPYDLLLNILSRIPVKSLVRFKCVCKSWYNLLTHNSYFITMHLDRSIKSRHYCFVFNLADHICAVDYFRNPVVRVYKVDLKDVFGSGSESEENNSKYVNLIQGASCHGLFLVRRIFHVNVLYLWNPATREHKKLPSALTQFPKHQRRFCSYIFGLGYDYRNNDYKVIVGAFYRSIPYPGYHEYSLVHVYSLRTNSVKRIQGIPFFIQKIGTTGWIFVKDSIHWLFQLLGGMFQIVAFDVTNYKYIQVPMPYITRNTSEIRNLEIGVLEDRLCLYSLDYNGNMNVVVMKEYGVKESWTKLFTLPFQEKECWYFRALFFNNHDEVILQVCPHPGLGHLVVFKPKESRTVYVEIHDLPDWFSYSFKIQPYVESLVSLKSTTFNSRKLVT